MYSYNWRSIDGSVFMHDIPFLYLDEERLSAGYLMKHIQLNDGKHKPVLRTLMELGMYDILLPALDLVERQMDHDNFCVSISCISKMPEYAELMSLLDDYTKDINEQIELSEMIRGKKLDMDSLIEKLHCSHVYNFVCEHLMSCADMILQSSNRCIGIVLFLLKNQGLNSHIAELFYKYALPASVRLAKDIMAKKIDDELIIAILRQRMCRYIVEYKQCLSKICDTLDDALYDISPENTKELTYGNFTEMIKKHSRSSCVTMLSITQQDMEVLSEFLDLSKIFLMTQKDISSYLTTIEENLPFLYHIVDLPNKANGVLRKMIEKSSGEYNPALILPMARTLYLQPDSADSKMMKKTLQRIIEATLACKALSDWINDCVEYFTIFLDRNLREISRLAECKKMEEQLLSTVGINRNLDDEYRHIDLIYEWLSQNTIIRKFISVRDLLDTRDMPVLSCGVEIEEVINLFYSITSHFDSSPRIIIRTCAKSLHHELSEYDDYEFSYPAAEIDVKTVEELTNRLQRILKNFPSTKYANNINKIIDNSDRLAIQNGKYGKRLLNDIYTALMSIICYHKSLVTKENTYNDMLASMLSIDKEIGKVEREKRQGASASGENVGELDIVIQRDDVQVGIIESIMIKSVPGNNDSHIERLIKKYDAYRAPNLIFVVFARNIDDRNRHETNNKMKRHVINKCSDVDIKTIFDEQTDNNSIYMYSMILSRKGILQKLTMFMCYIDD